MATRKESWFSLLFGFTERHLSYREIQSRLEVKDGLLISLTNNRRFLIGQFETPTLSNLISRSHFKPNHLSRVHHIQTFDVFDLHVDPENRHALFMAASQFNCLEFPHPNAIPEDGVTNYDSDPTQGPACALATAPATVFRNYLVPLAGQAGQTSERQINNLDLLEDILQNHKNRYFQVRNGYVDSTREALQRLNEVLIDKDLRDRLTDALKIGIVWDAEVPWTSRFNLVNDEKGVQPQLVSQAYCSAVSVGYAAGETGVALWGPIAQLVLEASYKAVLRSAIINRERTGCKKVFLTFLGGGVFANLQDWINDAIVAAIKSVRHADLDIYVVHFRRVNGMVKQKIEEQLN